MTKGFAAMILALALAGCASTTPAPVVDGRQAGAGAVSTKGSVPTEKLYTVKKGDTLKSIALFHNVDYRDLAAWNNIDNISLIKPGQQLRVAPSVKLGSTSATAPVGEGTEVRPIALGGAVVSRPLDGQPSGASALAPGSTVANSGQATAVPPVPSSLANTETLKRAPKGGKLPYSEENLARLKVAQGAAPSAVVPVPAAQAVTPPSPDKPAAEKPMSSVGPSVAVNGEVEWSWPAAGKLLNNFSESGAGGQELSKGIDLAGNLGDPVQAVAAGKVIYVGVFPKHGNLVVVLHSAGFSSVYAHNSRILVKEGQTVTRGQKIAELGNSDTDKPKLHFELRQQGKPVDPLKFLPPR